MRWSRMFTGLARNPSPTPRDVVLATNHVEGIVDCENIGPALERGYSWRSPKDQ